MNIGKAIRFYRIAHDITQKEIAEKAGLSMSYLSLLERGKRGVSLGTLEKVAGALNTPLVFIGG